VPPLRLAAIAVGLAGLGAMLGAGGGPPVPRDAGEWMGLAGGLIWAVSTTGIRTRPELPAVGAALVFALGAAVTAAVLSPFLQPVPRAGSVAVWPALGLALATASLFWVLSTAALIWAAARLEPARVGILLMTEVAVGAATAAWLDGERLAPLEVAGGALVLLAAVLELWPVAGTGRRRPRSG
jgi:drug/metabolite transporter (DMT)-like permease